MKKEERIIRDAMIEHGTPNWIANVPSSLRKQVSAERIAELRKEFATTSENIANRHSTKNELIESWCKENVFAEVTIAQLAEIGNCSKGFARKKVNARPDVFKKINNRSYEIRDPQQDRKNSEG
jgi:flagellar basal body rod protein FlgC